MTLRPAMTSGLARRIARALRRADRETRRAGTTRGGGAGCAPSCWAMPVCATCGLPKKPRGRDASAAQAGSLCDEDCPGYDSEPRAGHLWPGEAP